MDTFYHTVRVINRRDYTESQVSAWAPPSDFDLNSWQRTVDAIQPYIAEIEGRSLAIVICKVTA
ncbi:putative acetyltransferase [Vibrio sp. JCM 18905]|nr:putative acetyltransferase [Vibrio sp. JCM 18905]